MNAGMALGGLLVAGGVVAMLVMETKFVGMLVSGVGAAFLVLSFYSDFRAETNTSRAQFNRSEAQFNLDFYRQVGGPKEDGKYFEDEVKRTREAASAAESSRVKTEEETKQSMKPLADALKREVDRASVDKPKVMTSE